MAVVHFSGAPSRRVGAPEIAFSHNDLVLEACTTDDRVTGALWTSALKLSFLLGGAASYIDRVGELVERHGDDTKIHLVHFGGGMSGHIKLGGGRFFDWVSAGKKVWIDLSWAIGFAPRWFAAECEARGVGADRVLFAIDEPWGDFPGEAARLAAAFGDGELGRMAFSENFTTL